LKNRLIYIVTAGSKFRRFFFIATNRMAAVLHRKHFRRNVTWQQRHSG